MPDALNVIALTHLFDECFALIRLANNFRVQSNSALTHYSHMRIWMLSEQSTDSLRLLTGGEQF